MIFGQAQTGLFQVLAVAAFVVEAWALIDALRHRPGAYVAADRRTKTFWVSLTAAATVVGFLGLPYPLGVPHTSPVSLVGLAAIITTIIYLVSVRPAVREHRQQGPRGPRRDSRGGW